MDYLTRKFGSMLMQLFTLKWPCLWFFVTIAKEQCLVESDAGTPGCGQAGGQSPSKFDHGAGQGRWLQMTLEKWMSWEDLAVAVWAITGTGWGTWLQDEVLGALKSEAQQKPWRAPLACKQLLFQVCCLHSNQGPQRPAWWYSHSGIPGIWKILIFKTPIQETLMATRDLHVLC